MKPNKTSHTPEPLSLPSPSVNTGMINWNTFLKALNVSKRTGERWMEKGWIKPDAKIGNKNFVSTEAIEQFKTRAINGEFAKARA